MENEEVKTEEVKTERPFYSQYNPEELMGEINSAIDRGMDRNWHDMNKQQAFIQFRDDIQRKYKKGGIDEAMQFIEKSDKDFYDFLNSGKLKIKPMEKEKVKQEEQKVQEGAETKETQTPSEGPVKPNKVVLRERISSIYPDDSFDDDAEDEKLSGRILEMMDSNDAKTKKEKEVLSKLGEDPKMSLMLGALMDGVPFEVAASRFFDLENLPKEGEEGFEAMQKARNERIAEAQRSKDWQKTFQENMDKSEVAIDEFAKERGWSKEQVNEFLNKATDELFTKVSQGIIDKDTLEKLEKLYNYDEDVESARTAGEVAGRNQTIETKMKKMEGDGLPEGQVGGGEVKQEQKKKTYNPFLVNN
jgi:hypothetical protein